MGMPIQDQGFSNGNDGGGSGGAPQNGGQTGGVHPAWNEMLGIIPQELHSQVVPHLQNFSRNTDKVHQRYEPYKEFMDNGVRADDIRQALMVARALTDNPQGVYELLHKDFGNVAPPQGGGQGLPGSNPADGEDPYAGLHPKVVEQLNMISNLDNGFQTMAQLLISQKEQQDAAKQDADLESLYQDFAKKSPAFAALNENGAAEPFTNFLLQSEVPPEKVIEMFEQFVESAGKYGQRPKPPVLLGGGGGTIPGGGVDPRKLTGQQTREYIVQQLMAAKQANQ